ncbi:hypothetical protein AB5J49_36165 [Streptomyces sp. R28]|uniref:DUF3311 domain-containing protein n=1 Tax=Streptomyces sp. R28 TaxID=3238628 RepID=A0AB39Q9W2_9ACTN
MAEKDEPGGRVRIPPRRRAWRALLLVQLAAPALTIAIPFDRPRLLGIPLFYVLHFAICLLSVAVTTLMQRPAGDCDEPPTRPH